MATIQEEILKIKFSKLVKDSDKNTDAVLTAELIEQIEQIVQELVAKDIIVELE